MIRKLMTSCAVVALLAGGAIGSAYAQTDPANPPVVQDNAANQDANAVPATELAESTQAIAPDEPTLASSIIGRSVYSSADPESDNIGDVNDLIVSEDGSVTHAVVGVGGFLGMGQKNVAVPFDELEVVERDGDFRLVYAATREQLEAAPAFDRTAYDPAARAAAASNLAANDPSGFAPPPAPIDDMTAAPVDDQMAADNTTAPDTTVPDTAATDPAATDATSTDTMAAEAPTEPAAPVDQDVAAAENAMPASEGTEPAMEGFLVYSADQVRATDLIGQAVYSGEENIGEISDIILNDDGKTRAALVDVGGFLGAGEKTVALPFEDVQIGTRAEDGTEAVAVATTREQLEQLPAHQMPQDTAVVDPAFVDPMAPAPADTTAPDDQMAAQPGDSTAPMDQTAGAPAAADDQIVTGSIDGAVPYELAGQDLSANQLIGAIVYGADDANVGEISDVVFDKAGTIKAVVVDIGGFLGMGEKPVGVDFGSLNVRIDQGGTLFAMVDATQDQLDQAPAFQETAEQ